MKAQIFNNISWLFFDKIIRIFGSLLVGIWVARYLGPHDFGILNYGLAFIAFFSFFSRLGLDQITVRELTTSPEKEYEIIGTVFFLKLFGGVLATILIILSISFVKSDNIIIRTIVFIVALQFIFQAVDVIDYFFQAQIFSKYVVIPRSTAFVLSSLLKIYLITNNYSVEYFALAILSDFIFSMVFLFLIYQLTHHQITQWRFNHRIAFDLIKDSWPLMISTFFIMIHMKIDQVMIDCYLSASEVGVYSVAVRLSEAWYFIPQILVSTLMPYFILLRETDSTRYYDRLSQLYSIMFWAGTIVGIITIIYGNEIIALLFGIPYKGAYRALVFNIWAGIFISQGIARSIWMIGENLQKYRLFNNLITVNLNIILNMFLIPMLGISGAAISTLTTRIFGTWIISFLFKPLRQSTGAMIKSINPKYLIP